MIKFTWLWTVSLRQNTVSGDTYQTNTFKPAHKIIPYISAYIYIYVRIKGEPNQDPFHPCSNSDLKGDNS